jgi:transcriptional regulator with XRE-family HTH domain
VRDAGRPRKGSRWAALIREIVGQPGWSVQRLARESEIHRSTIFRWINGEIRTVSIESVQLIADAAGVDFGVALRAASDLIAGSPARNLDELSEEIKRVVDQSGLPEEDRFAIAQMLLDEFDRDELNRQRQRLDRARATVETWKRARGA